MNSDWKTFLETRGATVEGDRARFPEPADATGCTLTDLSHLGLIEVAGPDAADFLQGQLTNDVRALTPAHSHLSAHLTNKGRMLALMRVLRPAEGVLLLLPRPVLPALNKRLSMFRLRAKATLTDRSDDLVVAGLVGDAAAGQLATSFPAVPDADNGVAADGERIAVRMPGPTPRFLLIAPAAAMEQLWTALAAAGARPGDADHWHLIEIRAGLPQVYPETADAFVPQQLNLQLIDGVSFKKGCYTGQEVVARMQYLGKVKRRMYIAEAAAPPPVPGTDLHAEGGASEQGAGRVVDARAAGPGRCELLVMVEVDAAEHREVRLGGPDGPVLTFREPPYGFPAEG